MITQIIHHEDVHIGRVDTYSNLADLLTKYKHDRYVALY